MKKYYSTFAVFITVIMTVIGLYFLFSVFIDIYSLFPQKEYEPRCSPLSALFSEDDLVGTWFAGSPDDSDTLIIRADGTYKQIIHIEFPEQSPINYESDWQSWHLEYSKEKFGYLHLVGYSFCGMNEGISCKMRDGDGHDFCRDEYLPMNSEGILLVLETPRERYISLAYPLGSENSYSYSRQNP